ncbi:MFS transporter [Georgenia ruanii]|uniref:MFS transporter n=1 Tax=Georgenia ruanii TaxID=348442 RepID=A0A7J9UYS3_9MICO|nr:MFS transporter [Georgenia ruanii]MPV89602.1 MFS transporter [Georgenia ruanii]
MTSFSTRARAALPWAVVVGIVLVALSLRGPIVAPPVVIRDIQAELGLSATAVGLLTGLPVLCFALATPLATRVIRRAGPEIAVVVCLLGVLAGTIVRSAGGTAVLFLGTVIIGAAIAIGNVVVPVIIRRDVPWQRASLVTGVYTASLNVGSMITSLGTAPLAAVVGWRWALATWGLLAVAGAAFWAVLAHRRDRTPLVRAARSAEEPAVGGRVGRIGWLLMIAFCGQSFSYYAVTAWLPTLLADTRGLGAESSGVIASLFQIAAVVGAFAVPALAARTPAWVPVAVIGALWCSLPVGLLLAPQAYTTWSIIGGIAQGGGFTAIFSIIARVTRSNHEAAAVSARVQTGGYVAATFGPSLAGALHAATGAWVAPLLLVLVATLTFTGGGIVAAVQARRQGPAAN